MKLFCDQSVSVEYVVLLIFTKEITEHILGVIAAGDIRTKLSRLTCADWPERWSAPESSKFQELGGSRAEFSHSTFEPRTRPFYIVKMEVAWVDPASRRTSRDEPRNLGACVARLSRIPEPSGLRGRSKREKHPHACRKCRIDQLLQLQH